MLADILEEVLMPIIAEHVDVCQEQLGEEFWEVHKWLDSLQGKVQDHRQFRHNAEAIEKRFKGEELEAARIHVRQDIGGIPKDRKDYLYGDFTSWV